MSSCIPNNEAVKLGAVGGESLTHVSQGEEMEVTLFSNPNG
ncbi:MAG: hypothetical protein ACKPGT_28735 [Microcystis sp.]|uniref:Uncharacterized protein n=2 Tax=Microcystis TaxID=1125 RepID=I4G6N3_MICAE|nr:hypothetical protein VL20_1942 [Microcystis panniformis FACHB-1757]CCI03594.1 hypothetical protein MICAC_4730005 [Microcystis aeruginosa PCC 9443]